MKNPFRLFAPRAALACALLTSAVESGAAVPATPTLTLKENDLWVMAGDSITAQMLHTNYIEAYYQARYPGLHLHFRNSGIPGNRTREVLARFDYDVAAWKPTIVSVELGMNDANGGDDPAAYIEGMRELIAKIRAIPAQPVLISSSPVDNGSMTGHWKVDRDRRLDIYTQALKKLAEETGVVFIDQFHALIDVWGLNRRKGAEANPVTAAVSEPIPLSAPGAKPAKPKSRIPLGLIPLGGDSVHTGPVGQYTMAAAILSGLNVEKEVSSATLNAAGNLVDATRCKITAISARDGKLSFTRFDEVGPWPIMPGAQAAVVLFPSILELSQYTLKVTGLPAARYRIKINGKPAAVVDAAELAAGWNLTGAFRSVIGERATALLIVVGELQGRLNRQWRAASKAHDSEKLAAAQKAIEACEDRVREAARPVPLQFEIEKEPLALKPR